MEENNTPVISFSGADILGGDNIVVYGLDLQVYPGQVVYILGKVGSGKTSIFRTITAENRLGKGSGQVCGYDLTTLRNRDVPQLRRRIGVVFQDFQLLMDRTVENNLSFVLRSTGWKDRAAIAKRIERETGKRQSARAVGGAVGHNPLCLIVPCHRVVGSNGSLTGFGGGIDMKVKLLEHERAMKPEFTMPTKGTALVGIPVKDRHQMDWTE